MGDLKHQKTFSTKSVHVMAFLLFFGLFFFTISKNTNGDLFLNTKVAAAATTPPSADITVVIGETGVVTISGDPNLKICAEKILNNQTSLEASAKLCMNAGAVSNPSNFYEDLQTELVEKKTGSCDHIRTSTKIHDEAIGKSISAIGQCEDAKKDIQLLKEKISTNCIVGEDSSNRSRGALLDTDKALSGAIEPRIATQKNLMAENKTQKVQQAGTLKNLGCHIKKS